MHTLRDRSDAHNTSHNDHTTKLKPGFSGALWGVFLVSALVNILALNAPLFMLQVYDRVLTSRSVPTLVGLAALAIVLYLFQAALDILRARVLLRFGEGFDARYALAAFRKTLSAPLTASSQRDGRQSIRDVDSVRSFLAGPGPIALCDLPWVPFYLAVCFLFHFWIGFTALIGAVILACLTLITHVRSKKAVADATRLAIARNSMADAAHRNAEVARALGMGQRLTSQWSYVNDQYISANRISGDVTQGVGGLSKALRLVLQSAILAVGAWLVISEGLSPGLMIASSIMMGRALAPVDMAIAQWKPFLLALESNKRIVKMEKETEGNLRKLSLPLPTMTLSVEGLDLAAPGESNLLVHGVSFTLRAGDVLGIIGPSGSGKTCLARALAGVWEPSAGEVRLDGALFKQWDCDELGAALGFMPQDVGLFAGSIAQNIARFDENATSETVLQAARTADVHTLIVKLKDGYETQIGDSGHVLSAGQRQRVGLARALYRDPFLVVLDEPNANLDPQGETAVQKAVSGVSSRGGIAVVVAHRPSILSVTTHLLVMDEGQMKIFGPREDVLSKLNTSGIKRPRAQEQRVSPTTNVASLTEAVDHAG